MNTPIRTIALAAVATAALAGTGCASARVSERAAAVQVFTAEQAHPAITRVLGPVQTTVCLWSQNASSITEDALNAQRDKADAKGATALIDYRYQMMTNTPRQQQCRRYLRAQAAAVILQNGGAS